MPATIERTPDGKGWVEDDYRIMPGDPCPGASDFASPFHDLVFREFEVLRAFPSYGATLDRKPSRLVEALTVVEWERQTLTRWLERQEDLARKSTRNG